MMPVLLLGLLGAAPDAPGPLAELGFLAGRWTNGAFTAWYTAPDAHGMLSYSELVEDGAVVFHEFERFHRDASGVVYSPYPGGKPADGFRLTAVEERRAVFENPDKDFPTRIVFQRPADDRLVITLDDPHGASGRTTVFDLRRVP